MEVLSSHFTAVAFI